MPLYSCYLRSVGARRDVPDVDLSALVQELRDKWGQCSLTPRFAFVRLELDVPIILTKGQRVDVKRQVIDGLEAALPGWEFVASSPLQRQPRIRDLV